MLKIWKFTKKANQRKFECYQTADIYYCSYEDEINVWSQYIRASQEMIALSLDAKIIMNVGSVLGFFTRLIREKLSTFRLSESLFVDILFKKVGLGCVSHHVRHFVSSDQ